MAEKIILEVCAFTFEACLGAAKGGADRIELCANPTEGGTTPSYGLIKRVRESVKLLLFPIIRPRGGHYCFSADEFEAMREDIRICKELGCDGISVGIQRLDGTIDIERLKQLVFEARPMGVTCNRAFDLTPDPFQALDDIVRAGCDRILTSGQAKHAIDAAALLGKLVKYAGQKIIVMPGSGVRPSNIRQLVEITGAVEYHSAARRPVENPLSFQNPKVHDLGNVVHSDAELIREMRKIAGDAR
jgi:copper homeostasis protein